MPNSNNDLEQFLAEIEELTEPEADNGDKELKIGAVYTDRSEPGEGDRPAVRPAQVVETQVPTSIFAWSPSMPSAPGGRRTAISTPLRNVQLDAPAPPEPRLQELQNFTFDLMNRMHVNYAFNNRAFNIEVNDRRFSIIPEFVDDRLDPDELDLGPGQIHSGLHCTREYVPSEELISTPTFAEILEYANTALQQRHPSRRENRPLIRISPTGFNSPTRYQTPLQVQYLRWKQLIYDLPSEFSPEERQTFREMLNSVDYHRRSLFWRRDNEGVTQLSFDPMGYELDEVDWDRDEVELREVSWASFALPPNLNCIYGEMRDFVEQFRTFERRYSPNG